MQQTAKFLRQQETEQLDRYLGTGRHPNGGRNRHPRGAAKHSSRAKSAKRARSKFRMRSHRSGK